MTNLTDALDEIIRLAQVAKLAVEDEHEGNCREAIMVMTDKANQVQQLVRGW